MEPVVLRSPVVEKGRVLCGICFTGCTKKHLKRANIEELKCINKFENVALNWIKYEHEYNTVYSKHDWSAIKSSKKRLYAHKNCKGKFLKDSFMSSQVLKPVETEMDIDNAVSTDTKENNAQAEEFIQSPRSSRHGQEYKSASHNTTCIICNKPKKDKHGKDIPHATMTFRKPGESLHQAEVQLLEYAELHSSQDTKYKKAAERILLNKSTRTLFAGDVAYHRACYTDFRAPSWKAEKINIGEVSNHNKTEEFFNLVEYLVVTKKEIYTLAQLRHFLKQIAGDSARSIDLKEMIQGRFKDQVTFCKPSQGNSRTTEFVIPADASIMPDTIHLLSTGEGITSCLQLKHIAQSISEDIKTYPKKDWPPTPQSIIESDEIVNKTMYNFIAWIVSPNSYMNKDGFVILSPNKETIVKQLCENVQALVPHSQPTLSQVLLSLNMYAKTGSQRVVDDLKRTGSGISYTETLFILDKWAEWAQNQSSVIPGNIKKGIITTHVFDNIDWSNKCGRIETHLTNSILIQKSDIVAGLANISLEPNYEFSRKQHRSFKADPVELPPVNFRRGSAKLMSYSHDEDKTNTDKSSSKTLVWVFSRLRSLLTKSKQLVPGWSGFQQLSSKTDSHPINVGYLPPIPKSPTDMRVIYEAIRRTEQIMVELETDFIFIEADQAIYTKVIDAMFKMENEGKRIFNTVTPRMGGFHVVMCMQKTIFVLFKNCGIIQLLSAAGLGGVGTINKYLNGGDVNEGINLHKKLFEALIRSKIEHLDMTPTSKDETSQNSETDQVQNDHYTLLDSLIEGINVDKVESVLQSKKVPELPVLDGSMAKFLEIYLEMVTMMLNCIHFLRVGNWRGYLEVLFEFLPYCFRLNRHNYARDLSFYYVHMCSLEKDNSAAFEYLNSGGFSGSLTGRPHTQIPFDQVIEMTINRSCKDIGGLSRKTQNQGATERWTRTNHLMVAMREHMDSKTRKPTKKGNRDLAEGRYKRDEEDVKMIKSCLERWIPTLWSPTQPITNFATGIQATEEMKEDTLGIKEKGVALRDAFIKAMTTAGNKDAYYSPIKKQPIKLFHKKDNKKKEVIASDESQSFTEIFVLFDQKKLDLRQIMEWPVTSKPWAIVNDDIKSRNNSKSLFRNGLQMMSPIGSTVVAPNEIDTSIVDGMRVVRLIKVTNLNTNSFKCWAAGLINYLLRLPGSKLHLVFDDYKYQYSVPSKLRNKDGIEREIYDINQQLPTAKEWDDFLKNDNNKFRLINILVSYITSDECKVGKVLYVNNGSKCYLKDLDNTVTEFSDLQSNHREADQKIPMHVVFAANNESNGIAVVADDSDIYISLLYISSLVKCKLYFRQGRSNSKDGITYHDVHSVAGIIGTEICKILPSFHALTGSDYTNPFFNRTKLTSFRNMLKKPSTSQLLTSLATESVNIHELTKFILNVIYNRPLKELTPGEARYNMMLTKKKSGNGKKYPSSKALPPDQKSLTMKILRASFVSHCMVNYSDKEYVPLNPCEYGWKLEDSIWEPVWYEGQALPDVNEIDITEDNLEDSEDQMTDISSDEYSSDDSDYVDSDESSDWSEFT